MLSSSIDCYASIKREEKERFYFIKRGYHVEKYCGMVHMQQINFVFPIERQLSYDPDIIKMEVLKKGKEREEITCFIYYSSLKSGYSS